MIQFSSPKFIDGRGGHNKLIQFSETIELESELGYIKMSIKKRFTYERKNSS